jgi:hypothetical protein
VAIVHAPWEKERFAVPVLRTPTDFLKERDCNFFEPSNGFERVMNQADEKR